LEHKIANGERLLVINEMHKKGKIATVDFLWEAWNLSQPKGKPPQDLNLSAQERVDMWVQKLGGCPSFDDFLSFGTNLDSPKYGGARYVGTYTYYCEARKAT
jgi:hypothetical protein